VRTEQGIQKQICFLNVSTYPIPNCVQRKFCGKLRRRNEGKKRLKEEKIQLERPSILSDVFNIIPDREATICFILALSS
jgi:hypothetical protein